MRGNLFTIKISQLIGHLNTYYRFFYQLSKHFAGKLDRKTKSGPGTDSSDSNVYKTVNFKYLVSKDLPFGHVDSPAFEALLSYVRRCPTTSLPHLTRKSMRADLDTIYVKEQEYLKRRLAKHKGRFALTLEEWKAGNNYDLLAVTLHFHNNQFVLEKYVIGFKVLNIDTCYTGNVLYRHLDSVLLEHDIKDRIIYITRDNAGSMNMLMQNFKKEFDDNDSGLEFRRDIRCAGHVLSLAAKAFLYCISFRSNSAVVFRECFETAKENNCDLDYVFQHTETIPNIVHSIITRTYQNTFLMNPFSRLVKERKAREGRKTGSEVVIQCNDTRRFSAFRMSERFLYFQDQITEVLHEIKVQSKSKLQSYKLVSLTVDDSTWDHLLTVYGILKVFEEATTQLQGDTYDTSNLTIPYVCGVLKALEKWESEDVVQANALIAFELQEARKMHLQYYPVHSDDIETLKDIYFATVLDTYMKSGSFQDLGWLPQRFVPFVSRLSLLGQIRS